MTRRTLWAAGAALFFVAVTLAMMWPLPVHVADQVHDPGDPLMHVWALHWDWVQLFRDPLHLFDANAYYPARLSLAFSEHFLGEAAFGFPFFALGAKPIAVYNIVYLLGMALSGIGAWALAREMTGDALAAIVCGLFYEFVPFRFDHVAHLEWQWGGFLPLLLLFLWRYLRRGARTDLVLFALFFVANTLVNFYFGLFGGAAVLVTTALELTRSSRWSDRRLWAELFVALSAAGIVLAPFVWPYVEVSRIYHMRRGFFEVDYFSALPSSFLSAGGYNRLYGRLTARFWRPECQLFTGVAVPLLAAAAFAGGHGRREEAVPPPKRRPRAARGLDLVLVVLISLRIAYAVTGGFRIRHVISVHDAARLDFLIATAICIRLALAMPGSLPGGTLGDWIRRTPLPEAAVWGIAMTVIGVVLSLGTHTFVYKELWEIFGFALAGFRSPARWVILAHLGLGVLATMGLSRWTRRLRSPGGQAFAALVFGAVVFEFLTTSLNYVRIDVRPRPWSAWLKNAPLEGGVLELPMGYDYEAEYLYRTTEHGRPILDGAGSFSPPDHDELKSALASADSYRDLSPLLAKNRASVILFHEDRVSPREIGHLSRLLREGVASGELSPACLFRTDEGETLAFEFRRSGSGFRFPEEDPAARSAILAAIMPGPARNPPIGFLDFPRDGAVFADRSLSGFGWAASDSGMERIGILIDDVPRAEASYGIRRADVGRVRPGLQCGENCGFEFHLDGVQPGRHRVGARFVAQNGTSYTSGQVLVHISP